MSTATEGTQSGGTVRDRVEHYIARINRSNDTLNAVWTPTFDLARSAADAADEATRNHRSTGRLHGMIVALKDNINTAGIRTTSGSKLYEHYVPDTNATVWQRLVDEGAILIGKVGLHECVFGASSQNEWFGGIRNPWSTDHIPGGSSGGSGAAMAADFCDVALGTDTGGSVRIPSAMCGLTGLRPTMGSVSNYGVRPISPHLDTVGPMAWRVEDVARCFAIMQSYDERDETSVEAMHQPGIEPPSVNLDAYFAKVIDNAPSIAGLRVGVPGGYFQQDLHPAVSEAFDQTQSTFQNLGAKLVPIDLPDADLAARTCARIIVADAAHYYKKEIEDRPDVFTHQVMRRLSLGFEVSGVDYAAHMRFMFNWCRTVDQLFNHVDVVLTPTLRAPAVLIRQAEDLIEVTNNITPFTMAWALATVPNLTLPVGFSDEGLPVSCQLAARRWQEASLFEAGRAFQQATDFHQQRPTL